MSTVTERVKEEEESEKFVEGKDYYFEDGMMVLTAGFLLNRGYCCNNGCRRCPYTSDDQSK